MRHTRHLIVATAVSAALLCLTACSSSSASGTPAGGATHPTSPSPSTGAVTVSSTLDGLTSLPQRIHWRATPSVPVADVAEVDFLVDGRRGWVEHQSPYFYADNGNWLVTSFLRPGSHTFEVDVKTKAGATAVDKVNAMTTAPSNPPAELAGTWSRHMTNADLHAAGVTPGDGPPAGLWRYTFALDGLIGHDPQNGGGISDVRYLPRHRVQFRPTIEHPPYPSPNNGGFCSDTDPLAVYSYAVTHGGHQLVLHPVTKDPCPSRTALLTGTWAEAAPDKQAADLATH